MGEQHGGGQIRRKLREKHGEESRMISSAGLGELAGSNQYFTPKTGDQIPIGRSTSESSRPFDRRQHRREQQDGSLGPTERKFFGIARGSVQECVPLLELARRRALLSQEQHSGLKSDLEEISRMLSGLIKGLVNREV